MTSAGRRGWLRWVFGALGIAFVALALWRTWDESRQQLLPDLGTTLTAGVLVVGGLTGGGLSWIALFGPDAPRRLVTDFYLAQLAKYIPGGGIWQAAGQVGLSTSHGVTATRATANLVLHAGIQLVSALTLGGLLVFATDLPGWLRALCALGLATPLLLHRSWMTALIRRLGPRLRVEATEIDPPDQGAIIRSWLWSLLPVTGFGVAYGLIVHDLEPGVGVWRGAVAFAMAWAIGFALIPFPAGLGVREAALVVLVGGSAGIAVAASLVLRLLAIAGDIVLMAATRRIRS